jgi:hypothetical protein
METKLINLKGKDWLVQRDGTIFSPEKTTEVTRTRNGVEQRYSHSTPQKQIAPWKTKSGYLEVSIKHGDKRTKALVHRLVGLAFVPGYEEHLSINHINGIKTDNRPENLEWVTLAENTKHQWRTGLVDLRGDNHPNKKLNGKQVVYIRRLLRQGIPAHQLAVIAGVSSSTIALIQKNQRWSSLDESAFS